MNSHSTNRGNRGHLEGDQGRDLEHLRFISAGAGSGKTYRLTGELERALAERGVRPVAVIGATFTVKAATELQERVRTRLIGGGRAWLAEQMDQALIGTVHSVCARLLGRFAFELGLSPELNVANPEDGVRLFNQALDEVLRAPDEESRTPPDVELRSPDEGSRVPDEEPRSPDEGSRVPDEEPRPPDEGSRAPDEEPRSSDEGSRVPDEEPRPPDRKSRPSEKISRLPDELSRTPDGNARSSGDVTRTPSGVSQSPDTAPEVDLVRSMNLRAYRLGLVDDRSGAGWRDDVRSIAEQARSNDIDPASLPAMGRECAERFLGYFPQADCGAEAGEALLAAIDGAIADIDLVSDATKKTNNYVAKLRSAEAELRRNDCKWTLWISLSKGGPAKRSEAAAIPVRAAAARYDRHAGYHADIREYIESVYAIAGRTLARFQELKTARGLVDYPDMEQLMLRALDEPAVAERLADEVRLLLVDEFQDTNPMQLALFMKFAHFADEVVFVGDVKQAIFGFRGSDPELVGSALDALVARGGQLDVLDRSWRSRPSLVRYVNAVFADAFRRDGMARDRVELAPERTETHASPAVVRWTLPHAQNQALKADALALAIAEWVESGRRVEDPETKEVRPVTFGDIAVLAATNKHVQTIADALRRRRVPMKMTLAGLLETPEACLAKACLRRLNDPSDSLATAEIRALGACEEPEEWLADRLRWLESAQRDRDSAEGGEPMPRSGRSEPTAVTRERDSAEADAPVPPPRPNESPMIAREQELAEADAPVTPSRRNEPSAMARDRDSANAGDPIPLSRRHGSTATAQHRSGPETGDPTPNSRRNGPPLVARGRDWSETDDPIVSRIAQLRGQTTTQSPVEIVARVLNYVGIRPIVAAWGPDAITAAQRQRNLDAFLELSVEYEKHCASRHEAATLTGFLFWIENPASSELDQQPVVAGGDAVHVLTYHRAKGLEWPVVVATDFHYNWPSRLWNVRVEPIAAGLELDNPLEGRAIRFYPKVFGRNTKGVPVLDAILASTEGESVAAAAAAEGRRLAYVGMTRARDTLIVVLPPSDPRGDAWIGAFDSTHLLPAGDRHPLPGGAPIPSAVADLETAGSPPPESTPFAPSWFPERAPSELRLRQRISPSGAEPVDGATVGSRIEIGPRIPVHSDDMGKIGTALHAAVAAELVNPRRDDAVDRARELIRNGAGEGAVSPRDAVECAHRLMDALQAQFTPRRMLVEHPVELVQDNGQVLRGWIDLLLQTEQGWIVIDHKSSPRPRSEWRDEALEYSGQLAAYADALRGAGLHCAGCWVHFPVSGGLVEVVFG